MASSCHRLPGLRPVDAPGSPPDLERPIPNAQRPTPNAQRLTPKENRSISLPLLRASIAPPCEEHTFHQQLLRSSNLPGPPLLTSSVLSSRSPPSSSLDLLRPLLVTSSVLSLQSRPCSPPVSSMLSLRLVGWPARSVDLSYSYMALSCRSANLSSRSVDLSPWIVSSRTSRCR